MEAVGVISDISYNASILISICTIIFTIYKFKKQKKWNSELEKLKYSFEHNLTSYRIYIEQKHKRIIKVNQCMIQAYSFVSNIASPIQEHPDFSRYTKEEISDYLDKISLDENDKIYIINQWELNKTRALKEVVYWYNRSKCLSAYNSINKLKKHLLYVRLYIKEEDFKALFEFALKLNSILIYQETLLDEIRGLSYDNHNLIQDIQSNLDEATVLYEELVSLLRKALEIDLL